MAARLEIVSAERMRDEMIKLLLGNDPRRGLELLVDTGLIEYCLPEVGRLTETVDEHRRHKDVYAHTLTVLEQAIALEPDGPDLVLRLAALLHDIGKPKTKSIEAGGKVTFHHHEVVGASMTRARLQALRFPKDVVEDVARLVELHLRFHGYAGGDLDRRGGTALRPRRRPAAGPAASADPLGLHDPQRPQGASARGGVRLARGTHRRARRAGGPGDDPAGPRRQRDHGGAGPAAGPWSARPTGTCWSSGWIAARSRGRTPSQR